MERIAEILALLESETAEPGTLTDVQVGELETELLGIFAAIRAGEYEGVEPTDVETLRSISTAVENLRALASVRMTTAAEVEAEIAALEESLAATGGDDEAETDETAETTDTTTEGETTTETEGEGAETTEPVAVSAAAVTPERPSLAAAAARQPAATRPRVPAPVPVDPHVSIVNVQGGPLTSMTAAAESMSQQYRQLGPNAGKRSLVSIRADFPEESTLHEGDDRGNAAKLKALRAAASDPGAWDGMDSLAAAGWCVPTPVSYALIIQAMAETPVINSLPNVNVDRGGVRVPVSPSLSSIVTSTGTDAGAAVGFWTVDDDEIAADPDDPDFATTLKPFQVVDCPDWVEFVTYAVTRSLAWRNMAAKANPENVAAWNQLLMAAFARARETKVLDLMKGDVGTTKVTESPVFGAAIDIVETIMRLGAFMRSAERTGGQARLRTEIPAWVIDLMASDMARSGRAVYNNSDLVVARAKIAGELANANINATFYLDSPSTGPSQILQRQATGAARQWPCSIQYGLHFEGHYAFGDGGEIDLGVYRDTEKVQRNTYATFAESFDTVIANRGPEALWVTQDVIANGTFAAPIDGDVACAAS